jgi:putative salt-induced outer membrane protein YdiY
MKQKSLKIGLYVSACCLAATAAFGQAAATPSVAPTNSPPWEIVGSAGLTLTRGNSRTLLGVAKVTGDKKWDAGKNELSLDADGTYGSSTINGNSHESANQVHGFAQYNRLFTKRFYGDLHLDGLHDRVADIDYRITVAPGVGYFFIKEANDKLTGDVGPGYIYEKDHGVTNDTTHSYAILRLAERYDHKFNEHSKLWQSVEILPQVDKFSNYILNFEIGVESALTKKLSLQTYIQDSYHSDPAPGRLKNDVKLVAALAYKL